MSERALSSQRHIARRPFFISVFERVLDLVFPPRCVACRTYGSFLCGQCRADMAKAGPPRCPACWHLVGPDGRCRDCARGGLALKGARSAFVYEGAAREAVHALKFNGVSAAAALMAQAMVETLLDWSPPVEAIVPVPLAGRRQRLRGYNQSALLAREVARAAGLPLERRALVRRRATSQQARQPDEEARHWNVTGAFAVGRRLPSGGILLIDDVMTTGATLDSCARALRDAGCGPVYALTFARED